VKVRQLMSSSVIAVPETMQVAGIARLMVENGYSALPVVNTRGAVVGLVTEGDMVTKHARINGPEYLGILGGILPFSTHRVDEEMRKILAVTATDLMSPQFESIGPDDDVDDAATVMVDRDANPLLVLDQGRLVGILTRVDIVRLLMLEEENGADDAGGN